MLDVVDLYPAQIFGSEIYDYYYTTIFGFLVKDGYPCTIFLKIPNLTPIMYILITIS